MASTTQEENNELEHARVGSFFLGPRAENFDFLKECFAFVLEQQQAARKKLYPNDPDFITKDMIQASTFQESKKKLQDELALVSGELSQHSIPFWSPRYNAHMNMDTTLPGIVGYMTAMIYNPNNVATEASPFTTILEQLVANDHLKMIGIPLATAENPNGGWGHTTCDGSVANLESIWAARNLKFYPLSVKYAMEEGNPLDFLTTIDPPWEIETCKGEKKCFTDLTTWELLNLTPSTVLNIPTQLYEEYGISAAALQTALTPYLIQTIGKEVLEQKFNVEPAKYFVSTTKHYSWPKGGAITGIGSENFIDVDVDDRVRMEIDDLKRKLDKCLGKDGEEQTPVYAVVAIIGSTEHGACDPIEQVLETRAEYEKKGLSFVVHCDAAWGGYFASMALPDNELPLENTVQFNLPNVPVRALNPYTTRQLLFLKFADSITIDPHKSGYINYPAGGLLYRDQRMRYLVTWTSPIVYHSAGAVESIGVYGVEGSKPGAPAVATYLSHQVLGLTNHAGGGYGRLLGEAVFTCSKLYCHWATMTTKDTDLIVTPFSLLPTEIRNEGEAAIEEQKKFIRERILSVSNKDLEQDVEAFRLLRRLGGDLMINAFACNFKIDGKPNTDVGEANYLNTRIFQRLSVNTMEDVVSKRPLFLTSTTFEQDQYGHCLRTFKRRLQLGEDAKGDLATLVNVTMSPWPTDSPFLKELAESFRQIAEEEVKNCQLRNTLTKTYHGFIMQGLDTLFLIHMPMFNMADHRWQVIITADMPKESMDLYRELHKSNPDKFYTIANQEPALLQDLLKPNASFAARMDDGIPGPDTKPLAEFELKNIKVIVNESLWFKDLETTYPEKMPFYLYGKAGEHHIDHVLKTSPNAQLNSDCITVNTTPAISEGQYAKGVVAVLSNVNESAMQPLPTDGPKGTPPQIIRDVPGLSFLPGKKYAVEIYNNYVESQKKIEPIAKGHIGLGKSVYADWKEINMDPVGHH